MTIEIDKKTVKFPIGVDLIQKVIPHRSPFLLVDCVTEMGNGWIKGYKNVTINEPFFQGHFPEFAIMPGVLIVEAMAQLGAFYAILHTENYCSNNNIYLFLGIDLVKFKAPVLPGDKLEMHVESMWEKAYGSKIIKKCKGNAHVNNQLRASAELSFALVNLNEVKK